MSNLTKKIPRPLVEALLKLITNVLILFYRFKFKILVIRKNTSDHYVFRDIFLLNEFKLPIEIKPKFIVDTGAYIGLSTLYYAKKYPDAQIVAVEPELSNFETLSTNTEINSKISRINAGIWSKNTKLKIVNFNTEKWAFSVTETDDSDINAIQAITIDEILLNSGFDEIDILKIDIEGSEMEIFSKNCDNWLKKVKIIVLELHDRLVPGCSDSVYGAIKKEDWFEFKKGEKVIFIRKQFY
jgi:FkbM family methyltransferase